MKQSHVWDVNESYCFRLLMMMVVIVVVVPLLMMIIVFECLSNLATMFVIKISQIPNKHRGKVDDGILCSNCMCNLKRIFTGNWKWTMNKRNGHFLMCTYFGWLTHTCVVVVCSIRVCRLLFQCIREYKRKRDRSVCQSASWNMGNYLNIWPLLHHGIIKINKVLSSACIFSQTHINQLPWTWTLVSFPKSWLLTHFLDSIHLGCFFKFLFSILIETIELMDVWVF